LALLSFMSFLSFEKSLSHVLVFSLDAMQ